MSYNKTERSSTLLVCTAIGKAMLAFMSDAFIEQVLEKPLERFTDFTITDPDRMWEEGNVDYPALAALTEWYIAAGVSGLFAVYQSSEMFHLSLAERVGIASATVKAAAGRVPVIASGHISDSPEDQAAEITAVAATGVNAVILVTNRLAAEDEDDAVWLRNLKALLERIPTDIKLGFYECPYPYKRLIGVENLRWCAENGRFYFSKDTCCDIKQIRAKLAAIEGSNLKLYNANTSTLLESLQGGAVGYSGVMANFHPALYMWLCHHFDRPEAAALSDTLSIFSLIERQLYPVNAKYNLALCGLDVGTKCRTKDDAEFTATFASEVKMLKRLTDKLEETCK